ncbi:ImuA family protein [Brevundimonas sp. NPDC058933]|uniref:ImuA family protein n=1 Tax=Brevundimonas sp. NPDC058933 TaxID=3346673 RepID=UPI003BEED757
MTNIRSEPDALRTLKARLEALNRSTGRRLEVSASECVDNAFAPLATGVLHDLYAATPADAVAVNAFGLGMASRASEGRPIVWVLHEMMSQEAGRPYGPGLHEMGLAPRDLMLVRARDIQTLLAVGEDALRSSAVGAVLLSAWGEAKALSLTASRRLALAAEIHGATLFLARSGADPCPSAAETRWSIGSCASEPLEAGAPGRPSFSATLLRRRGGGETGTWIMEWDREQRTFRPPAPLSGGLVPLAAQRSAAAPGVGTGTRERRAA